MMQKVVSVMLATCMTQALRFDMPASWPRQRTGPKAHKSPQRASAAGNLSETDVVEGTSAGAWSSMVVAEPADNTSSTSAEMYTNDSSLNATMSEETRAGKKPSERSNSNTNGDVAGERSADVGRAEAKRSAQHEWSYLHPGAWGDTWEECGARQQSPVDISVDQVASWGTDRLSRHYRGLGVWNTEIVNGGHNLQVNGLFGVLQLPDGMYVAKQFHLHFPSEHTVDGKHLAGEIHIVHQREGAVDLNGLAVLSILLDERVQGEDLSSSEASASVRFLRRLGLQSKAILDIGESSLVPGELNIYEAYSALFEGPFWHYRGSLTTPPCSETVHWYVLQQPGIVPAEMVSAFKRVFPDPSNARPTQPLNARRLVQSQLTLPGEFRGLAFGLAVHPVLLMVASFILTLPV